ncbi:MAG: mucoidy inhibitor MuiA family protein [Bacteroidota bacterium]
MKRKIFVLFVMFFTVPLLAANEVTTKPSLDNVKVFLNGAELIHSAKVKVDKGVTDIILSGLAGGIDRNSLNVTAKGDAVTLSVVQRFDYLRSPEKTPQIKALEDSLEYLTKKVDLSKNEVDVLNIEIELLLANKKIGSDQKNVTVAELQSMAEFFRKRLNDIKTQQLALSAGIKKLQKEIDRINKQLAELNNKANQPVNELIVTISAQNSTALDITFSYIIYNAGWHPVYDLRVDKIDSPAKLSYKANVWQNSGLSWDDVNIVLSTRNPNQNNNKPELYPWFIDFERYAVYKDRMGAMEKSVAAAPMQLQAVGEEAETIADYIVVNQKQLSVEFVPTIKYSIPPDGKPHTVSIQDHIIKASYEYYAAPKLDNNAFLVTNLTGWNEFNLLPGQANIYFENSYVGESYIDPFTSKDTLTISLGRDQNISVTKEVIKDFTEDKFLSSDIERIFAYEIKIKNNKNVPVKILVEEQLPISKNEDIEVKVSDISDGKYFEKDGKVKWIVEVSPEKSISKKFVYSVRYPKDKVIMGL